MDVEIAEVERTIADRGFWFSPIAPADPMGLLQRLGRLGRSQSLRPMSRDDARPHTTSAAHGFDAFPWHTDGAVVSHPPRLVALLACAESSTATEIVDLESHDDVASAMRRLVLVAKRDTGRHPRYFSAVGLVNGRRLFRWDPDKLEVAYPGKDPGLGDLLPDSAVQWGDGDLLILDNWRCVHRRQAVDDPRSRELRRTYIYD